VAAISSPLLEASIDGAKGVVLNITGGHDLTLHEVNIAAETIYEVVDPNANIIFGAVIDEKMQGEIKITVIATGFSPEVVPMTSTRVGLANPMRPSNINQPLPPQPINQAPPPQPINQTPPPQPINQTPPVVNPPPVENPPKKNGGLDIPDFLQRRRFPRR
jgi:cell division protein FtsZ